MPAVSARELYRFLERAPQHYARWSKKTIVETSLPFRQDWKPLLLNEECSTTHTYNYAEDFALALPFAKKLAMMARSERGEQARDYFPECERLAVESLQYAPAVEAPSADYITALERHLQSEKEKLALQRGHEAD